MTNLYLQKPQLRAELEKCLQCPTKPCRQACPVKCSPCDFIAAAKADEWQVAAALIRQQNPLGETCGLICPDKFCMKACLRRKIDASIQIPAVQAAIMHKARLEGAEIPEVSAQSNGKHIAVIGLGPAGIGAISVLLQQGFSVSVFEKETVVGGALNLIPQQRLPAEVLYNEWSLLSNNPLLNIKFGTECSNYTDLLQQNFDAVIVAVGEQKRRHLGIEGENLAIDYTKYLKSPSDYQTDGHVAIIGGGAVAVDCAVTAARLGAKHVEMFVRRRIGDMRITPTERTSLMENKIDITTMTRLTSLVKSDDLYTAYTVKTEFAPDGQLIDVPHTEIARSNLSLVILALGSVRHEEPIAAENVFYAGDFLNGGSTAVEAVASGQNAARQVISSLIKD